MANDVIEEPSEGAVASVKNDPARRPGFFAGIALFLRQVVAELKKVVTPTRKELLNYTAVVLVFVVIMMALVTALDLLFGLVVANVFGDGA